MAMYEDSLFDLPQMSPSDSGPSPAAASTGGGGAGGAGVGTGGVGTGGKGRGRDGKEKETFACPHPGCGQSYSRMEYLKRHQRKHQDVRPFNCKDCGKAFARSDVLLRHRRRCHPTPPPDAVHSPPATGRTRSYPGVPVSSSRNDSRDLSPGLDGLDSMDQGTGMGMGTGHHGYDQSHAYQSHAGSMGINNAQGRKHPREESGSSVLLDSDDRAVRPRFGRDSYDDGSDIYGIRRAMRNELYDSVTGEYYDQHPIHDPHEQEHGDSSASYTPHLLPMFQHPSTGAHINQNGHHDGSARGTGNGNGIGNGHAQLQAHSRNTSGGADHLEDASVLLSMAYGLDADKPPSQSGSGGGSAQSQHEPLPAVHGRSGSSGNATATKGSAANINSGGHGDESGLAEDQHSITKAALHNINMFGDMSWMTNQVHAAAPNEQQVKDVSDWMSSDLPLIDPALTGLSTGSADGNGPDAVLDANHAGNGATGATQAGTDSTASTASSNTPLSPFPLASLFSPSLFEGVGLSLPASGGVDGSNGSASSDGHTNTNASPSSMGTGGSTSNSSGGFNVNNFNFDFGSPAGIYNTLNTLNMFNANADQSTGGAGAGGGGFGGFMNGGMTAFGSDAGNGNDAARGSHSQNQNPAGNTFNNAFNANMNMNMGLSGFFNAATNGGNLFGNGVVNQFGFNDAQMSLLEQMAAYQVPQTRANPNPERPIMRIEHAAMRERQGKNPLAFDARFYLDADRFSGCYQIPHWKMPPIRTLSLMASRTFDTVLNHFSFVHAPTFKLTDAAACLAFAICTIGGIRNAKQKSDKLLDYFEDPSGMAGFGDEVGMDGPVLPEDTWEGMYRSNYANTGIKNADQHQHQHQQQQHSQSTFIADNLNLQAQRPGPWTREEMREAEETKLVQEWDAGHTVRNEKTNMLVKSFSLAKGVLMTEYNVALLQALILYHAPYFLSEDDGERACANMFLGTIVNITRQIGFLSEDLEHFETAIRLPTSTPASSSELNACWRRWIQLETRRRVAYLVYHLDTISSLESNIPCILSSCEIGHMPLPAPDTIWRAPTAQAWLAAVKTYRPMTLDEGMRRIFFLPSFGAFDEMHQQHQNQFKFGTQDSCPSAKADGYNLLNEYEYGPFARSAMILTLLRGIMDIGEGKRDRGDWRDLTDLWVSCSWLRPGKKILDAEGNDVGEVSRESLRERFALGLQRWRQGWDFDFLCQGRGVGCTAEQWAEKHGAAGTASGSKRTSSGSAQDKVKPPHKLTYCEEALPFYWLAQALVGILSTQPSCAIGTNQLKGVRYNEMLKSARRFTRTGEGAPCAMAPTASGSSNCGSSTNVSPRDHETGSTTNTYDFGTSFAGNDSGSGIGHGNVFSPSINGTTGTSVGVSSANSGSGIGLTPDMIASWGAMAGMSPASFNSAISAAIGSAGMDGGAGANSGSTSGPSSINGTATGLVAGATGSQTLGSGIQLTPPTMAGFASLPVGVGVGIGPGFGVDLGHDERTGGASGDGSGSGGGDWAGWLGKF